MKNTVKNIGSGLKSEELMISILQHQRLIHNFILAIHVYLSYITYENIQRRLLTCIYGFMN